MIKTLKSNITTTLVQTKYDPEWTYIEVDTSSSKDTAIYAFYKYEYFDASKLFSTNDIVIDWGDGTVNSEDNHSFKANTGQNNRVVVKIKNLFKALQLNADDDGLTFEGFMDPIRTVGALSIGKNNSDSSREECLSLNSLFRGCPIDHIDPHCFDYCQNIWEFSHIFEETKISEIPENLFANCRDADRFDYAFASCPNLKSFPVTLFDKCLNADNFWKTFMPADTDELFDFLVDLVGADDSEDLEKSYFEPLNTAVDEFFGDRICKLRRTGKA